MAAAGIFYWRRFGHSRATNSVVCPFRFEAERNFCEGVKHTEHDWESLTFSLLGGSAAPGKGCAADPGGTAAPARLPLSRLVSSCLRSW